MSIDMKATARRIAARFGTSENPCWDVLRDYCDFATQCDLDCIQLDILADMVARRIELNSGQIEKE